MQLKQKLWGALGQPGKIHSHRGSIFQNIHDTEHINKNGDQREGNQTKTSTRLRHIFRRVKTSKNLSSCVLKEATGSENAACVHTSSLFADKEAATITNSSLIDPDDALPSAICQEIDSDHEVVSGESEKEGHQNASDPLSTSNSSTTETPCETRSLGSSEDRANHQKGSQGTATEHLKVQLEKERATVAVLKKQKEAITKDLDYLGNVVDNLTKENEQLQQQLDEKEVDRQAATDSLDMMLEKLNEAKNNAKNWSLQVDQMKKAYQTLETKLQQVIQDLHYQLEQKDTEIQQFKAQQPKPSTETLLQRPDHGARSLIPSLSSHHHQSPISTPTTPIPRPSLNDTLASKDNDLDHQLLKLTREKERLQSSYSRIPLYGGNHQLRRHKEELEVKLDEVDMQLSKVKQQIKHI